MTSDDISWSSVSNESFTMTNISHDDMMARLKAIEEEKDSAYDLLQATLRTDTLVNELDTCSGQVIRETIEILSNRSDTTGIIELEKKAVQFGKLVVDKCPSHAVSVMLALDRSNGLVDKELTDLTMTKIRSDPSMMLSNEEVTLLSETSITTFLADKGMVATESIMFRILLQWIGSSDERRLIARENLLKHIDLMLISPADLSSDEIRKSGIVTDSMLFEIVVKQFSEGIPRSYDPWTAKRCNGPLVWNASKSRMLTNVKKQWKSDSLSGVNAIKGSFEYKLQVEHSPGCALVVGISTMPFANSLNGKSALGTRDGFIGLHIHCHGSAVYTNGSRTKTRNEKLENGSIVELKLLYGKQLSLSSPGSMDIPEVITWDQMAINGRTCIPVAGVYGHGKVEIVSFEQR